MDKVEKKSRSHPPYMADTKGERRMDGMIVWGYIGWIIIDGYLSSIANNVVSR